jgi:hypothetical protein
MGKPGNKEVDMGCSINFSGEKRQCRTHNGIAPISAIAGKNCRFNNSAALAFS